MFDRGPEYRQRARDGYEFVREAYPDEVDEAQTMIVGHLRTYDPVRLRVFLGETDDPNFDAFPLRNAHLLISSMLHQKKKGNEAVTPIRLEAFSRAYLQLPFAVLDGNIRVDN